MGYPQQGPTQQQPGGYQAAPNQYASAQQPGGLAGIQMKRRNIVAVWLGLPLITAGIYGIVWFVKVHSELAAFDQRRQINVASAVLSIFFGVFTLFIWPLMVWYKLGEHIGNAQRAAGLESSCSGGLGLLLGILGFGPLYYQLELNKVIDRYGDTPAGTQVPLAA